MSRIKRPRRAGSGRSENIKDLGAKGFASGALYNAARPNYPVEALEYLVSTLRVDATTRALDLGAGTGIFSRQILPFVGSLIAVDPSGSMRDSLAENSWGIEVLEGSDVAIPLASESVDVVFAAQAFHWFDAPVALREIHRVLAPSGGLGLIWNERDESYDWVRELHRAMLWDIRQPYVVGTDFSTVVAGGPFTNVERVKFRHRQLLSHEQLFQRVLSTSYLTVMDEDERDDVMASVASVVEAMPSPLELPYVTDVYSARATT